MCGIIALFNPLGKPVKCGQNEFVRLRDIMTSRGPDDSGYCESADRSWCLGHRRLSILDLSPKGHQPMASKDGKVHIVFNGEIYNFLKLRHELVSKGHQFESGSDTEVILSMYDEYGLDCIPRFDGMFAFVIVDERKGEVVLARDVVGKKPLYYARIEDDLMVASDPGVIASNTAYKRQINPTGLYEFFVLGGVKSPETLFKGIFKLPPASYMQIRKGATFSGLDPVRYRYLRAPRRIELLGDEEQACSVLDEVLHKAVQKRMISDVPFGLFLSGGIDSGLILSYMAEHTKHVNTFSIDMASSAEDKRETYEAARMADSFRTNHHEVIIDDDEYFDIMKDVIFKWSIPTCLPDSVLAIRLAKLARENGVYVVETGEGADELFLGYKGYPSQAKRSGNLYNWRKVFRLLSSLGFHLADRYVDVSSGPRMNRMVYNLDASRHVPFVEDLSYRPFYSHQVRRRLGRSDADTGVFDLVSLELKNCYDNPRAYTPDALTYCWHSSYRLADFLLDRVDRVTMEHSVEARAPFMDLDVIGFGLSVDTNLKYRGEWPKYLLRKLAEKRLTREHAYRPKRGFGGANKNMLNARMAEYLRDALQNSPSYRDAPVFKADELRNQTQLFVLASFHLWRDKWM